MTSTSIWETVKVAAARARRVGAARAACLAALDALVHDERVTVLGDVIAWLEPDPGSVTHTDPERGTVTFTDPERGTVARSKAPPPPLLPLLPLPTADEYAASKAAEQVHSDDWAAKNAPPTRPAGVDFSRADAITGLRDKLWALLRAQPGVGFKAMAVHLYGSNSYATDVKARSILSGLKRTGRAVRTGHGTWVAVVADAPHAREARPSRAAPVPPEGTSAVTFAPRSPAPAPAPITPSARPPSLDGVAVSTPTKPAPHPKANLKAAAMKAASMPGDACDEYAARARVCASCVRPTDTRLGGSLRAARDACARCGTPTLDGQMVRGPIVKRGNPEMLDRAKRGAANAKASRAMGGA